MLTFGQFQQRLHVSAAAVIAIAVLFGTAIVSAVIVFEHRRLMAQSGLSAVYRAGTVWEGQPDLTVVDNGISATLVRQRSRDRNGAAFTVVWRGYLIAPEHDRYRFSVLADDHAWIEIDKRPVIDSDRRRREAAVELARGLHPITIRYHDDFGLQDFDVRWARGDQPTDQIPRLFLLPQLISGAEALHRVRVNRLSSLLPLIWSGLVTGFIAAAIVYRCTFPAGFDRRLASRMVPLYLAGLVVFGAGISWGLPDDRGWAVDEITPGQVQDILEHRFSHAWATTYPPLHFGVLSLASIPVYAARALAVMNEPLDTYSRLFIVGRMVSIAMALCVVAFVYRLTLEGFGDRAARFAVIVTLLLLPLTYYAKTANLDVPYLFWLTASWLFYLRAVRTGSAVHACVFAATGAAAIATKDQAYGFYVLPAMQLVFTALRGSGHQRDHASFSKRGVYAMAAAFVITLVTLFNVPFNRAGVIEHLRLIVGPGSQPFRMYAVSITGYAELLRDSVWQIGSVMSWPMFGFAVCGVALAIRERFSAILRLLLSALSYYLTFIAIVMYHYDRFFIGICLALAVAAGVWLDRWTREDVPARRLRLAVVAVAIAYGAARVVSLDALMLNDSRYYVERWLAPRIGPDTQIAAEGTTLYLPRQSVLLWTRIGASAAALREMQPQFLILNASYRTRVSEDPGEREFFQSLGDGRAGYRQVLRYRTWYRFSPLRLEPRFNGPAEDQFSNVTKVNPTIEVYERVDTGRTPK